MRRTDTAPGEMYGLVGRSLGHSFSKRFFTDFFERHGINARYVNFELADIGELARMLASNPTLAGFNVTIPYKRDIIPLLQHIDPTAQAIGAVNVVSLGRDGSMTGYNTDVTGFTDAVRPMLDNSHHRRALVLGVGGATRAIVYALTSLGLSVDTVSRRPGAGTYTWADVTPDVISEHTVIVNCTPLGTWPDTESAPPLPYEALTPRHVCFDLVYNPAETKFMKLSGARGAAVSNGLAMLHGQALAAWRIWQLRQAP